LIDDIKRKIIEDRLKKLFKDNAKNVAKILKFLIKRDKKNV